jgi:hypothetical protein
MPEYQSVTWWWVSPPADGKPEARQGEHERYLCPAVVLGGHTQIFQLCADYKPFRPVPLGAPIRRLSALVRPGSSGCFVTRGSRR